MTGGGRHLCNTSAHRASANNADHATRRYGWGHAFSLLCGQAAEDTSFHATDVKSFMSINGGLYYNHAVLFYKVALRA
jgi:hypothetical protein